MQPASDEEGNDMSLVTTDTQTQQALEAEMVRLGALATLYPAKDQHGVSVWDLAIAALNSAQKEE